MIIEGANSENGVVENDGDVTDAEEGRERGDRPITILRNTLKWGHLCPTAPGTEIDKDRFLLFSSIYSSILIIQFLLFVWKVFFCINCLELNFLVTYSTLLLMNLFPLFSFVSS